jgi:lincosamide nucleotidyltransferase A/C/D/E
MVSLATTRPNRTAARGLVEPSEVLAVLDALDRAGVRVGITGGWGVDALLRKQTRAHRDLDLGLAADSVDRSLHALALLGYVLAIDERPARLELHGVRGTVDLHPIVWDATGHGIQTRFDGQVFEYPRGSLSAEGEIAGRSVQYGTPQLQWVFHQGYEPGAHDHEDMAALAAAFPGDLPPIGMFDARA